MCFSDIYPLCTVILIDTDQELDCSTRNLVIGSRLVDKSGLVGLSFSGSSL
jgi:hypothetical protein